VKIEQPTLFDAAGTTARRHEPDAERRLAAARVDADPRHHARTSDPDTSHLAAAAVNVTRQARAVLAAYLDGAALLDVEAYDLAGFPMANNRGQRCSDLRRSGFIERTGTRRRTPNGQLAHECRITAAGRSYLVEGPS